MGKDTSLNQDPKSKLMIRFCPLKIQYISAESENIYLNFAELFSLVFPTDYRDNILPLLSLILYGLSITLSLSLWI